MAHKYKLTIRNSASPHLYLDQIKEIIKNDDYLLPAMRKTLLLLKKFNKTFIQLPLQMEVVISKEYLCNLERTLSPTLLNFNRTKWDAIDEKKYAENKDKFLKDVVVLYEKMGYEVKEEPVTDEQVKAIVEDIDKREGKFGGHLLDKIK